MRGAPAAIGREDPRLCAFLDVWSEEALARLPDASRLPLAGLPFAVKGPAGCPAGLQLVAGRGRDAELLGAAGAVERALPPVAG